MNFSYELIHIFPCVLAADVRALSNYFLIFKTSKVMMSPVFWFLKIQF